MRDDALPREIAGHKVALWAAADWTAQSLDTTTRTLRRWEALGLPSGTRGKTKLYPFPQAGAWMLAYRRRGSPSATRIPIEVAWPEYTAIVARDEYGLSEPGA